MMGIIRTHAGGFLAGVRRADAQRLGDVLPGLLGAGARHGIESRIAEAAAVIYLEIDNFFSFQSLFGQRIGGSLAELMEEEVEAIAAERRGRVEIVRAERMEPGKCYLLLAGRGLSPESLPDLSLSCRLRLRSRLKQEALKLTGQTLDVLAGHALLGRAPSAALEQSIYGALCDARRVSRGDVDAGKLSLMREFREIVAQPRLSMLYQPIMDFDSGSILAWEALARGPAESYFAMPSVLFDFAEDMGQVFALERACRVAAVRGLGALSPGQKLFLNIHPRTMVDPEFSPGETLRLLAGSGLSPSDVVFEITERHRIRDFTLFHSTLEHYRSQGFQVAVDDVGTGYSGLWSIAELRPDFIKIDMSLIRGIDANPVKRALLETFVTFADKIGCRLIAEGIETERELTSLMQMGVHLGQGYHLARPGFPKPMDVRALPARASSRLRGLDGELSCSIPLRKLMEPAYVVRAGTKVSEVKRLLAGEDPINSVVAVGEDNRPLGLIMSHHLDRALSSQYGMSLYYNRDVTRIMDPVPLTGEADTPVEKIAQQAMGRERYKIYDHIVVTDKGRLAGIVSVQRILDTLASVQVEMAKGASPLTGLPGNVSIEQELEARADGGAPFSVIYSDLDNFKAFNDTYGFKNGDNIILLASRVLTWAVRRHGKDPGDFVGHVGGDDFVAVVSPERAERVCTAVIRCFGRLVRGCYNPDDRARGYIEGRDRVGNPARFPLVAISLAIVDCLGRCDLDHLGQRAAEMKKYAKSIPGNAYARDRRGPLSQAAAV